MASTLVHPQTVAPIWGGPPRHTKNLKFMSAAIGTILFTVYGIFLGSKIQNRKRLRRIFCSLLPSKAVFQSLKLKILSAYMSIFASGGSLLATKTQNLRRLWRVFANFCSHFSVFRLT